ncbi:unnamed protein product [Orchesella dallaii]|uniref:Secreted protein n=1 Tax=Orchesella dallaii TaxID=48710 RepID=A0ABP1RW59_9HEXA
MLRLSLKLLLLGFLGGILFSEETSGQSDDDSYEVTVMGAMVQPGGSGGLGGRKFWPKNDRFIRGGMPHLVDIGWPFGGAHPTKPQHAPRYTAWGGGSTAGGNQENDPSGRFLDLFPSRKVTTKKVKISQTALTREGKWLTGVQQIGSQRFYNYSYVKDTMNSSNKREDFVTNTTVWRRKKRNIPLIKLPQGPFNENN